jgi:hypothetical protein
MAGGKDSMNRQFCRDIKCLYQELIDKAPWDMRILQNCNECNARKYHFWLEEKMCKGENVDL